MRGRGKRENGSGCSIGLLRDRATQRWAGELLSSAMAAGRGIAHSCCAAGGRAGETIGPRHPAAVRSLLCASLSSTEKKSRPPPQAVQPIINTEEELRHQGELRRIVDHASECALFPSFYCPDRMRALAQTNHQHHRARTLAASQTPLSARPRPSRIRRLVHLGRTRSSLSRYLLASHQWRQSSRSEWTITTGQRHRRIDALIEELPYGWRCTEKTVTTGFGTSEWRAQR